MTTRIRQCIQFLIVFLTLGLGLNGMAQAEMTLHMSDAGNPCAMKGDHNPCSKSHNPCNPCSMKQENPCNPCAMKHDNPCNPCAMKHKNPCNPCAMKHDNPCNPCAMKHKNPCNPCAMKHDNPCNPCAMKHKNPCNPCAVKNPCGAAVNPCAVKNPCSAKAALGDQFVDPKSYLRPAGTKLYKGGWLGRKKLVAEGEALFNDTSLSGGGNLSCNSCHGNNELFKKSFATPYPHQVQMTIDRSGYHKPVSADEFVQFCIATPMSGKTLPWNSRELGALTAYVTKVKQKEYMKMAQTNPCAAKNPCAIKNPCAVKNPCAAINPCDMKNPCATKNPCDMKNPCSAKNPCAMKNPCSKW